MTSAAYHFEFTPCTTSSVHGGSNACCSTESNRQTAGEYKSNITAQQNNCNVFLESSDSNMSLEPLLNKWGLPAFDASAQRGMVLAHFTYAIHPGSSLSSHHHHNNNVIYGANSDNNHNETCPDNVKEGSEQSKIQQSNVQPATTNYIDVACSDDNNNSKSCHSSMEVPFHVGMANDFLKEFFTPPEVQKYFPCERPIEQQKEESKGSVVPHKHNNTSAMHYGNNSSNTKELNTHVKSTLRIASVHFSLLSLEWHSFAPFKRLCDAGVLRCVHHVEPEKKQMQEKQEYLQKELQPEEAEELKQTEENDKQSTESTSHVYTSSRAITPFANTATHSITKRELGSSSKINHDTCECENEIEDWCTRLPVVKRMEKILTDGSVITDELRALFLDTPIKLKCHLYQHGNEHLVTSMHNHNINNNNITDTEESLELCKERTEQEQQQQIKCNTKEYREGEEEDDEEEDEEDDDEYYNFSSFDYYHDNSSSSKHKQLTRKERRAIFTSHDQNELLYHIVWHLVAGGGAFNQYDEDFAIYLHAARQLFRRLVTSIHVKRVIVAARVAESQSLSYDSTEKKKEHHTADISNKNVSWKGNNKINEGITNYEQQQHDTDEAKVKYEPHIDSYAFAIHRIHIAENIDSDNNCKPCSKVQRQTFTACTLLSYINADQRTNKLPLSNSLWPSNVNYCYVIVNPHERSVVLWYHHMK